MLERERDRDRDREQLKVFIYISSLKPNYVNSITSFIFKAFQEIIFKAPKAIQYLPSPTLLTGNRRVLCV